MSRKQLADRKIAELKNLSKLWHHKQRMENFRNRAEGKQVMNPVHDFRLPLGGRNKFMFMMPERIGSDPLLIDKIMRTANMCDLGQPCHGDPRYWTHAILDHHSLMDFRRECAEHTKVERGRSDLCEVVRIGKKCPAFFNARGNRLPLTKKMNHSCIDQSEIRIVKFFRGWCTLGSQGIKRMK